MNGILEPTAHRLPLLSTPVLAQVLERRATGQVVGAAVVLHLGLTLSGLPAWDCPLRRATGLPCPGCGLSRAMAALFHGDWRGALTWHAFAPVVLVALGVIIGMAFLPEGLRRRGIDMVARLERRTGLTAILLLALMAYWFLRLLLFRDALIESTRS